jgi:opacity protein-like surface antigen
MAMILCAGWLGTAGAQTGAYRNYGQVRGGWNGFDGDLDDADYDGGVNFAVAYGRYLTPYLVVEGGLDVFGTSNTIRGNTTSAGSYEREDSVAVVALLTTIKGELPAGPLTFFGGGGVGGYLLTLASDIDTARLGDFDKSASDTVFGVHAVAGVHYAITERFFAGVQGSYRWTEDVDISESVGTVPVRLEGDLNGYQVMLSAGFRF